MTPSKFYRAPAKADRARAWLSVFRLEQADVRHAPGRGSVFQPAGTAGTARRRLPSLGVPIAVLLALTGLTVALGARPGGASQRRNPAPALAPGVRRGMAAAHQQPGPHVYVVPPSIPHDCAVGASNQLMRFFATVPNGSIIRFPHAGCYGEDNGLRVTDRRDLVIDGNGSSFKTVSQGGPNRSNWELQAGRNITLENMAVYGANARAGTGGSCYYHPLEWQHGYDIEGTQGATLRDVRAYGVYGDFVEAQDDSRLGVYKSPPARNIVVENSRFDANGRMGIGLTDVDGFLMRNSYVGDVCWDAVDLELDVRQEYGRNIQILGNTFGKVRFTIFANLGAGSAPHVGRVTMRDNVEQGPVTNCAPPVDMESPSSAYRSGYTFLNNHFLTDGDAFRFVRGKNVAVSGNTVLYARAGCSSMTGVVLTDSHGVTVTDNTFSEAAAADRMDSLSTDIIASGNRL